MQTAAILLGIGAVGGMVMAAIRLKGTERPPSSFAMAHGVAAASGLTLLVYSWFTAGIPQLAQVATIVLVIAALGGTYINLQFHAKMKALPIALVVGHATIAAVGFVLLLLAL